MLTITYSPLFSIESKWLWARKKQQNFNIDFICLLLNKISNVRNINQNIAINTCISLCVHFCAGLRMFCMRMPGGCRTGNCLKNRLCCSFPWPFGSSVHQGQTCAMQYIYSFSQCYVRHRHMQRPPVTAMILLKLSHALMPVLLILQSFFPTALIMTNVTN